MSFLADSGLDNAIQIDSPQFGRGQRSRSRTPVPCNYENSGFSRDEELNMRNEIRREEESGRLMKKLLKEKENDVGISKQNILFLSNLPENVKEGDIEKELSTLGHVEYVQMFPDDTEKKSSGSSALVRMHSSVSAQKVVKKYNPKKQNDTSFSQNCSDGNKTSPKIDHSNKNKYNFADIRVENASAKHFQKANLPTINIEPCNRKKSQVNLFSNCSSTSNRRRHRQGYNSYYDDYDKFNGERYCFRGFTNPHPSDNDCVDYSTKNKSKKLIEQTPYYIPNHIFNDSSSSINDVNKTLDKYLGSSNNNSNANLMDLDMDLGRNHYYNLRSRSRSRSRSPVCYK